MTPLNPNLYGRLLRVFGEVAIANKGEAFFALTQMRQDKPWVVAKQFGEYYRVNCPFCGDTRKRLWINHMYGKKFCDNKRLRFLAICYNENCLANYENRKKLHDLIDFGASLSNAVILPGKKYLPEPTTVSLPGLCRPLHELPKSHPACVYLEQRGFSPEILSKIWGVSFCEKSPFLLARERIVTPIYFSKKLVGWQCRYVGELPWHDKLLKRELPPKYYTMPGFHKSQVLYNLDIARNFSVGVIVEGAYDVYKFGPMACATFGTSLSERQVELLRYFFPPPKILVLLFDADAGIVKPEHGQKLSPIEAAENKLRPYFGHRLLTVKLPDGHDPGSMDRVSLRLLVEEAAKKAELDLTWSPDFTERKDDAQNANTTILAHRCTGYA